MKVSRRETFNAAHRLFVEGWSDEKNLEIFGKCSNPNYHGHNYVLEVIVEGEIDAETGYVIDLKVLKEIIHEHVLDRFDHRNLNLDCIEFKGINPTAENIAKVIWDILSEKLSSNFGLEIILAETDKNKAIYNGK
ncbi:MAG: 6-pyruvoyltetrahydropterin/6-carboxytetrahydropterin synthase [Crocinitomicaceae bacterium]|jgi:6-pyruvoyltetrahydropterin/6-carboxytetrahydropterin synthase